MKETIIYLIRHSEQLKIDNKVVKNENSQIENEKIILSVEGENKAKKISELEELKDINILWCSNYVRAIATAKYIAEKNNIEINIDENFGERKLGDLKELEIMGKDKKHSFTTEQLLDENLKNKDGENRKEVIKRMEYSFDKIFLQNINKKIVIVSHGAAIKFLLTKWCKINSNFKLEYNNTEIKLNSPGVLELKFEGTNLINLRQIV